MITDPGQDFNTILLIQILFGLVLKIHYLLLSLKTNASLRLSKNEKLFDF